MLSMKLDQDVRPLSEFRARVADFILKVTQTGRPLLITQRGRGVVVLIDVREFSAMQERLELLEGVLVAQQPGLCRDGPAGSTAGSTAGGATGGASGAPNTAG